MEEKPLTLVEVIERHAKESGLLDDMVEAAGRGGVLLATMPRVHIVTNWRDGIVRVTVDGVRIDIHAVPAQDIDFWRSGKVEPSGAVPIWKQNSEHMERAAEQLEAIFKALGLRVVRESLT